MRNDQTKKMAAEWWYYTVELADGSVVKGMYPDNYPLPPRIMQRRVNFAGMDCLDIGSAEGLLPILAKKNGARRVIATDYIDENLEKLNYLAQCHNAPVDFRVIGRAQNVDNLAGEFPTGFDYVNLSGVLYHVTSPFDTVMAARTMLRPNGLMLVSAICLQTDRCMMEFNDHGRFQAHFNAFWYLSAGFFDYALRMLSLKAVDVISLGAGDQYYVSVLCRAVDGPIEDPGDPFAKPSMRRSPEFDGWRRRASLPPSSIAHDDRPLARNPVHRSGAIDIYQTMVADGSIGACKRSQDSLLFLLSDRD